MQENISRRSNKSRSDQMRSRLIKAARALFVEKGYAETGTPEIVKQASVTRGALYHHFSDKADLFRAVVIAEAQDVACDIEQSSAEQVAPERALVQGAKGYFNSMRTPGRVRLLLLDGPAVLGPVEMASIDSETGGNTIIKGLKAMDLGAAAPIIALSEILSAGFERAAIAISSGADEGPYLQAMEHILDRLDK